MLAADAFVLDTEPFARVLASSMTAWPAHARASEHASPEHWCALMADGACWIDERCLIAAAELLQIEGLRTAAQRPAAAEQSTRWISALLGTEQDAQNQEVEQRQPAGPQSFASRDLTPFTRSKAHCQRVRHQILRLTRLREKS